MDSTYEITDLKTNNKFIEIITKRQQRNLNNIICKRMWRRGITRFNYITVFEIKKDILTKVKSCDRNAGEKPVAIKSVAIKSVAIKPVDPLYCELCKKKYKRKSGLSKHLKSKSHLRKAKMLYK